MVPTLALLQLAFAAPTAIHPTDSITLTHSVLATSSRIHFESYIPVLPAPKLLFPRAESPTEGMAAVDTPRTIAIEYSNGYYTRLAIHKYASYATIPLFVVQYLSGQSLVNHPGEGGLAKSVHGPAAAGIGVLFGVNTVTGLWNLYDSRKDPNGRTRRTVHSLLMLAADAGFVWTGAIAPGDDNENGVGVSSSRADKHRTVAITSGSVALASYLMMLIWKD